jgi:hypothetical protein
MARPWKQLFGDIFSDDTFFSTILQVKDYQSSMKVSTFDHSQGAIYMILVSGRRLLGSDDLATTLVSLFISTLLPSKAHQTDCGWSLLDVHVIYVGLLDGMSLEATIC